MSATADAKPPYGGFRTFWNFVELLHENRPVPQYLDRSVMGQRGGTGRSELYTALRFFGLIDGEKQPTARLEALVEDPNTEQLRALVVDRYAPVIALNLQTATPPQVDRVLIEQMGATAAIVARCRTFFLNAAEDAGVEVGKLLKTARAPTTARRRPKPKPKPEPEDEVETSPPTPLPPLIGALVAKLPPEEDGWTEADAKQWIALVTPSIAYDYKLDPAKLKAVPS